jgi:hypothetical protein
MRTLACSLAALGALAALAAIGSGTPAVAAVGQCFDASGRPFGPPHNTDNPPYRLLCEAYRRGGYCTNVQPGWAEANCDIRPRYRYREYRYDDDGDRYYRRRYWNY